MRLTPLAKLEKSRITIGNELAKLLDNLENILSKNGLTKLPEQAQAAKKSKKKRKKRAPSLNC
jgi:ElaB/YqjD/DUF883 family membrane-anchored ribosome-binding protein